MASSPERPTGVFTSRRSVRAQMAWCVFATMKSDYFETRSQEIPHQGAAHCKTYHLGDAVRVKLIRADKEERQLDFELIEEKKK
jgi:hypothetical protein